MYETYFGLTEKPFQLCPDDRYLYVSDSFQFALSALQQALSNGSSVSVVTGMPGSGKTSLILRLKQSTSACTGVLSNTKFDSYHDLLRWILLAFDLDSESGADTVRLYKILSNHINDQFEQGRQVVLVVDESQNLNAFMLERLRLLTNPDVGNNGAHLQLVLVGQIPLCNLVGDSALVLQRVAADCYLKPLDLEQTREYINYRLKVAGTGRTLFTRSAVDEIAIASKGMPRAINIICDAALLYGFSELLPNVGSELVRDVVRGRLAGLLSLPSDLKAA